MKKMIFDLSDKVWVENKIALSNSVYINFEENLVYKKYDFNDFNDHYGNQERKILKYLNDFKLYKSGNDFIVLNYIKANSFDSLMLQNDLILLKRIAEKINEIHQIDIKKLTDIKIPNYAKTWEWLKTFSQIPKLADEDYYFQKAMQLLKEDLVLANNDIVDGNILFTEEKIYILDYEYGGINNRMFDLASFIVKRQIPKIIEDKFLEYYYQDKKFDTYKFLIIRKFVAYFWAKWSYYKYLVTEKEIYLEIFNWLSKR